MTSVMPCRFNKPSTCSMTGLLTMGTIGLGRTIVSGRRRDPSPPAISTAFIANPPRRDRVTRLYWTVWRFATRGKYARALSALQRCRPQVQHPAIGCLRDHGHRRFRCRIRAAHGDFLGVSIRGEKGSAMGESTFREAHQPLLGDRP